MAPLVRDSDVVLVAPICARSVQTGDVVLYRAGSGCAVVHRVVRVTTSGDGRWFTLQGDRVTTPDGLVPERDVYGRVVALERNGALLDMETTGGRTLARLAALRSRW